VRKATVLLFSIDCGWLTIPRARVGRGLGDRGGVRAVADRLGNSGEHCRTTQMQPLAQPIRVDGANKNDGSAW